MCLCVYVSMCLCVCASMDASLSPSRRAPTQARVCMYVCMYTHTHTYICMYMTMCVYNHGSVSFTLELKCVYVCLCLHTHVHVYIYMSMCVYIHESVSSLQRKCVCMCVYVYVQSVFVYISLCVYMHRNVPHTRTTLTKHTHKHTQAQPTAPEAVALHALFRHTTIFQAKHLSRAACRAPSTPLPTFLARTRCSGAAVSREVTAQRRQLET